ncbi:hypothetical protein JK182_05745 [Acetobacter okinawensis]|uniref:hypothetical protein n=1 Tax=Acetobacter okinawensis TaxID=1076594 RepID=UPI001BA80D13|nr:hypothetical protein [Acetobacter okinawensis]MBS0988179.1 hypothetical protein [Acetobacter okinawensis]
MVLTIGCAKVPTPACQLFASHAHGYAKVIIGHGLGGGVARGVDLGQTAGGPQIGPAFGIPMGIGVEGINLDIRGDVIAEVDGNPFTRDLPALNRWI